MLNTIVLPSDGSENANKAARFAGDIAAKYGSRVILVHQLLRGARRRNLRELAMQEGLGEKVSKALDEQDKITGGAVAQSSAPVEPVVPTETLQQIGNAVLEHSEAILKNQGVQKDNIERQLLDDDPVQAIVDLAERRNADAIIMGSRGLSNWRAMVTGSVSNKVANLANCTVISVK